MPDANTMVMRAEPILQSSGSVGAGASLNQQLNLLGQKRVVGNFDCAQAPAAGFPRIRQSVDGVNWSIVFIIPQDLGQANLQFPFNVEIRLPYVSIEFTQGAAPGNVFAGAYTQPI